MTAYLRSVERKNKIIKTLSVGFYAKVVGVIVSFAIVRLAVDYLGSEQYGLWVAVSSLIAMLSFADGGVGNALVNSVSRATSAHSNILLQSIISTGYSVVSIIALIGLVVFLSVYSIIPWGWVFGIHSGINADQLSLLVLIVGASFFFGMPLSVVGNIQRGFQEGNLQAFWNAKGRIFSLFFVYISIQMDSGILGFAIAFVMGPIVAAVVNTIKYFLLTKKDLFPKLSLVTIDEAKIILGTGGLFFILQITSAIQQQSDNIIISNMLGPSLVAKYSICMQLFMVVPMIMGLLWAPLWPAYREAISSGDIEWAKRVFKKSLMLALAIGLPLSIILVLFGQSIIRLWVGNAVVPSMLLLLGCGIWMMLMLVGNVLAVFLNAVQWLKVQIIIAASAGALNIIFTIILIKKMGVEGAVYGSVLSYTICALIPYAILIPSYIKKMPNHAVSTDN